MSDNLGTKKKDSKEGRETSANSHRLNTSAAHSLVLRYFFGVKTNVRNNLIFIDDTTLCYPCGHTLVIYNTDTKDMQFIQGVDSVNAGGISAIALSPKKRYVAIAEKGDAAVVQIYDITTQRKRKTLSLAESGASVCISVEFSPDQRYLLVQSGPPDYVLSLWTWEKFKLVSSVKINSSALNWTTGCSINSADMNPVDGTSVCISGNGIIKFFKIAESQLRIQATVLKRESANFLCHSWVSDDRVVAAADTGELWLFEQFELRQVLASAPSDGKIVSSIVGYAKGFICGCSKGIISLYDRVDDGREYYKKAKSLKVEGNDSDVGSLAISPNEDTLVCCLANHQLYVLALSSTDMSKENSANFEYLLSSFHASGSLGGDITGLDTCIRKPLLATCGYDKTIRIWNYLDRTIEVTKSFKEEMYSIAMHPSGLHIAAGFADKLIVFNVLLDNFRPFRQFAVKSCREIRFSHGGQYFAAVNANTVHVYATYTGELLAVLRGHSNRVNAVSWALNDRIILTCALDGSIITWKLRTATRAGVGHSQARCSYMDAVLALDTGSAYATGSDGYLKEVNLDTGSVRVEHQTGGALGPIALASSRQYLYTGSTDTNRPGSIRVYRLPLQGDPLQHQDSSLPGIADTSDSNKAKAIINSSSTLSKPNTSSPASTTIYTEYQCHDRPITRLRLSFDNQFLFSASQDGSLAIFEILDASSRQNKNDTNFAPRGNTGPASLSSTAAVGSIAGVSTVASGLPFAEEVLVARAELEEKQQIMCELKGKVNELVLHNEYQLRLKANTYEDKLQNIPEKLSAELTQDKQRSDDLKRDQADLESKFTKKLEEIQKKQETEQLELKKMYERKIFIESERLRVLQESSREQSISFEQGNYQMIQRHTQLLNELVTRYEQDLASERTIQVSAFNKKQEILNQNEKDRQEHENGADLEMEDMQYKYEIRMQEEKGTMHRLKLENNAMKKKFAALQKEIEDQREEISAMDDKSKELIEVIKALKKDISGHQKEIREREETIQDKDKRIDDLKKKNQELEKFKFVLDYKIKELKRQIEPREQEIVDLKQQLREMDAELEQYHKSNGALDLMVGELRLKIEGMEKEVIKQRKKMDVWQEKIQQVLIDLAECMEVSQDPKSLKFAVIKVHKKYENEQAARTKSHTRTLSGTDYNRQREYLEKQVISLRNQVIKGMSTNDQESHRAQRENAILTAQMNELRRELHIIQLRGKQISDENEMAKRDLDKSGSSCRQKNQEEIKKAHRPKEGKLQRPRRHFQELKGIPLEEKVQTQRKEIEELKRRLEYLQLTVGSEGMNSLKDQTSLQSDTSNSLLRQNSLNDTLLSSQHLPPVSKVAHPSRLRSS